MMLKYSIKAVLIIEYSAYLPLDNNQNSKQKNIKKFFPILLHIGF